MAGGDLGFPSTLRFIWVPKEEPASKRMMTIFYRCSSPLDTDTNLRQKIIKKWISEYNPLSNSWKSSWWIENIFYNKKKTGNVSRNFFAKTQKNLGHKIVPLKDDISILL